MSVLSDDGILARLGVGENPIQVDPFDLDLVQPASLDIRLGNSFKRADLTRRIRHTDTKDLSTTGMMALVEHLEDPQDSFTLYGQEFVLGTTLETFRIPNDLIARIEGKSSLGRLGLLVHATAGFVDPGFSGELTLELYNLTTTPILLYPGMKIAQISFMKLATPCLYPYGTPALGSHYQNQRGATASRYGT